MLGRFCVLFGVLFVGCGQSTDLDDGTSCASDADCAPSQVCSRLKSKSPGARPAVAPRCPYPTCTTTADCSGGTVCGAARDGWASAGCGTLVCIPPCTPSTCASPDACQPCPEGQVCRSTGICELSPCDEVDAAACPERWHCDPEAAKSEPHDFIYSSTETYSPDLAIARGCVRTRCDEDDGFVCNPEWVCEPENASEGTGCAPIPCAELDHCVSDSFICMPTSSGKRPTTTDPFGCVSKNCEDGYECSYSYHDMNLSYCDATSPLANDFGCRLKRCDEVADLCPAGYECAPDDENASDIGCIAASGAGGTSSSGGMSTTGGMSADGGSGNLKGGSGAGGTSGTSGTSADGGSGNLKGESGAGAGGSSSAGASGDAPGRCVAPN